MSVGWYPCGPLLKAWAELRCALRHLDVPIGGPLLVGHIERAYALLEAERQKVILEVMVEPLDVCSVAIENAREQAAGVLNPVASAELREAVDKAERAAAADPLTPQSAAEYATADRLAQEWVAHE